MNDESYARYVRPIDESRLSFLILRGYPIPQVYNQGYQNKKLLVKVD